MAYNAALNTIYNHYLTAYAPKSTSRYDAHKRSELRNIYNTIVKLNQESPLYLPEENSSSVAFAVGLKENARQLRNTIASLGGLDQSELLGKKTAYSTNSDLVDVSYIGSLSDDEEIPSYEISVQRLATSQVNVGTFLLSEDMVSLPEDAYSFDLAVNDMNYEFQFNIREGETNRQLQERLSRLITNADVGLKAEVVANDTDGTSALRLTDASTGVKNGRDLHFTVSDDATSKQRGSVAYFGLDQIQTFPANAAFTLNGEARSTTSNRFTVDKLYEISLNGISSSDTDTASISVKTDVESLTENIGNLIDGYNSFLSSIEEQEGDFKKSQKLLREMNHVSSLYKETFEQMGISREESGHLSLDQEQFEKSILSDETASGYDTMKDFTNAILRKTDEVSLNPMQYVERTIAAYKNPGRTLPAPYAASAYSGMMFNYYC